MKTYLYLFVALFLIGCTKQEMYENVGGTFPSKGDANSQYAQLIEQARWGDGQAFLKLADFYHNGQEGQQDFLGTLSMLAMADQYDKVTAVEDYMSNLPKEDNMRLLFEAMYKIRGEDTDMDNVADKLIANGSPEGYTLRGITAAETGDVIEAEQQFGLAVAHGSAFAEILLTFLPDWRNCHCPKVEKLIPLVDRIPLACKLLGDVYAGKDDKNMMNEALAVQYYQKADEKACLGQRAAQWLLDYYVRNEIQIDEKEMKRLQILSGHVDGAIDF